MKKINWYEPSFGEEEKKLVNRVLDSGFVTEGPFTKELEEKLQKYLNVKHVILTTNGTSALFLAIKADQIIRNIPKEEYEIIVPDLTFIATPNSAILAGVKPVLVDIEKERFCIDIESIKRKITPKTRAIMPVQITGRACNISELKKIAKNNNLTIIEDAAGCLGSKNEEGNIGTLGKLGCFSLQANKIISCGHGGFVVTNEDKYFEIIKRLKDFGRLHKEEISLIEGYNFKFNDVSAAVALGQFKSIEERKKMLIEQRRQYEQELENLKEISFPKINYDSGEIPLWVDVLVENREKLVAYLNSKNIFPRKCWPPVHRHKPYSSQGTDGSFPVSSFVSDNCLWLPNGPKIKEQDIRYICEEIRTFYSTRPEFLSS